MVATTDTALPTLPGGFNYPAPTVPPTSNAPYRQASLLPEDFVFIVVGAFIALVASCILAWRIMLAWSINRSFKRPFPVAQETFYDHRNPLPMTSLTQHNNNEHTSRRGDRESTNKRGTSRGHQRAQSSHGMSDLTLPRNFSQSASSSLFFSPTAEAARYSSAQQLQAQQQRGLSSQHLPAGHYKGHSDMLT